MVEVKARFMPFLRTNAAQRRSASGSVNIDNDEVGIVLYQFTFMFIEWEWK